MILQYKSKKIGKHVFFLLKDTHKKKKLKLLIDTWSLNSLNNMALLHSRYRFHK